MKSALLLLAAILISLAWLSPFHTYPWVTFSSELATFGAALVLLALFLNRNIQIPKLQLYILPVVIVPLLQWSFGLVFDFSIALLSSVYLLGFWFMVVMGYNLSLQPSAREQLMQRTCWLLLIIASVSSLMAMVQWLGLESSLYGIMQLKGNRPYANFGQPNNMATFLVMGLMGALYLYEKQKASVWLLASASLVILFAIALSQSRTSWVVCLFIFIYWIYKQFKQTPRLNILKLSLWCCTFFVIAAWGVPVFTHAIESSTGTAVIEADSIVERASSGYLRFEIWTQMLLALKEQPWWGYGWNQTSVAQMTVFPLHPSHEWVTSGHNVLLDILIWNGIPLGLLIIAYMAVWLLWLNKNTKDSISIIAMLMVSAILIHAMLEFPQRYAYFLLPMGFLLGLIQAQTPNLKGITLHKNVIRGCWVISLVLLFMIWRDYKVYQENSQLLFKGQQPTVEIMGSSRILLLSQFQQRLVWIALKPTVSMSDQDLMQWSDMVKNKATPYNLKKYAQLLVYNQKMAEAEQQLFILQQLYGEQMGLADIVELNHSLK